MRDFLKDNRGQKVKGFKCTECGYTTKEAMYSDKAEEQGNMEAARAEGTLGRYGPNGNGYNYWCPKDSMRMVIIANPYSALDAMFGFN